MSGIPPVFRPDGRCIRGDNAALENDVNERYYYEKKQTGEGSVGTSRFSSTCCQPTAQGHLKTTKTKRTK